MCDSVEVHDRAGMRHSAPVIEQCICEDAIGKRLLGSAAELERTLRVLLNEPKLAQQRLAHLLGGVTAEPWHIATDATLDVALERRERDAKLVLSDEAGERPDEVVSVEDLLYDVVE